MGNIIRRYPSDYSAKAKCKYIGKYAAFFMFQALLIGGAIVLFLNGSTPTCSSPNLSCGCQLISAWNIGFSTPCPTLAPYNQPCIVSNEYFCCDTCVTSLGVCSVCTNQVTMVSNLGPGLGCIAGQVVLILITLYLIFRKNNSDKLVNQQSMLTTRR